MRYKKPLLALALGALAGGLALVPSVYADEPDVIKNIIPCNVGTYKVDKNYDASRLVMYSVDNIECAEDIVFDLNGKKIEDGYIWLLTHQGKFTLIDSVGTGSIGNLALRPNEPSTWQHIILGPGTAGRKKLLIESGHYSGSFDFLGGATISGGVFDNFDLYAGSSAVITGGIFNSALPSSDDISIELSGGIFSEKPDEKYLVEGYAIYEESGKYVVRAIENNDEEQENFVLTNFFQYMYVGQSSKAYISPGRIAKTAKVTSSDESILDVACEDSTIIPGQMMIETSDGSIGSKACTLTAKRAGKATISYTTDYDYNGSITVYVADIDATAYGDGAESAKYALTAHDLSLYAAEPLEHSWLSTAPSAVGPGYDLDALKKKYAGVADAVKAGHGLRLTLEFNETTLTDAEKELIEGVPNGNNIAAAYSPVGSVVDITTGKSLVDQVYSFYTLPLPEILKNRSRTIQVVNLAENTNGQYGISAPFSASIEDGKLHFNVVAYYYYGYYGGKMVVLYDGEPITSGSLPDTTPKAPNSGSQSESVAIILGASAAVGLPLISVIIYLARRKATARKLRF